MELFFEKGSTRQRKRKKRGKHEREDCTQKKKVAVKIPKPMQLSSQTYPLLWPFYLTYINNTEKIIRNSLIWIKVAFAGTPK